MPCAIYSIACTYVVPYRTARQIYTQNEIAPSENAAYAYNGHRSTRPLTYTLPLKSPALPTSLSLATLPLLHKQKVHSEVGKHNKRTGKHTQPDAVLPQRHHIEPKRAQDG